MENTWKLNHDFETIAWGAFFVLWGITEMVTSLPDGMGTVGIGLILIALNVARSWKGLPISGFSTTLGILALVLGGLELAQPYLHLSFEIPYFAILLIVLGLFLVGRTILQYRKEGLQ
jgi:hypothetical protein